MSDFTVDRAFALRPSGVEDRRPAPPTLGVPRIVVWETLGWLLMAALLVFALRLAYLRAMDNGPDLALFYKAGRYVLQHGARDPQSALARYWPSADVLWVPFSLLPISVTVVVWHLLNCAAWLALLRTICERLLDERGAGSKEQGAGATGSPLFAPRSLPAAARRHATLAAGLLAMPLVVDGMSLGGFHVIMLWLMLAGLDRAFRGRTVSGGILLGIAAWLKLVPLLGVGLLLYHRKWKAAAIALATVVVLDVALSLAAFGPAGAWREHVRWWQQGARGTADRQLTCASSTDEDRLTNQSVAITLRRLLTLFGIPDASVRDRYADARRSVRLADLSPEQLRAVYLVVTVLLLAAVAIYCRPVGEGEKEGRRPEQACAVPASEFASGAAGTAQACSGLPLPSRLPPIGPKLAMLCLATLWFSPVTWSYHFVAAVPALALLLLRARYRWLCVAPIVLVWCGALCLLGFDAMRAAGVLLWMSLLLGAGLVLFPMYSSRFTGR